MNGLILVDIQNDFLPGGALAVNDGDKIIPVVNAIQDKFLLVVATQDWHPEDHGSFASNHPGKEPFEMGTLADMDQVMWPDHCVQGKKGSEFSDALNTKRIEAIFRKGTDNAIDSYSGFFDNGKKKSTGLGDYLKGKGIENVYLAGLAADFCVGYTALDALELGFKVFLIEDATRAIDQEGWLKMKNQIINNGGKIIRSSEL